MVSFEFNGKGYYIDNNLKEQFDTKIIPDLKKRDKDAVFVTDGGERKGKSVFTMIHGAYLASKLNSPFDLTNVCMNPLEFRNKIKQCSQREVVIYDEAHRGMGSSRTLSEINNILKDLMMECGQKNLCIFVVLPTFFLLDKYAALFRSRGLFHIYERRGKRGYWCYFNERKKLELYMKGKKEYNYNCIRWPDFRGRFLDQYPTGEEEYRSKKRKSFEKKDMISTAELYKHQRDQMIWVLHKELDIGAINMQKLIRGYDISLKKTVLGEILAEMRLNYGT